MIDRNLRLPEVEKMTGFKKSYIYRAIQNETFPKPFHIGRSAVWKESWIKKWLDSVTPSTEPH